MDTVHGGDFGFNLNVSADDNESGLSKVEANFRLLDGANDIVTITEYFSLNHNAFRSCY